MNTGKRHPLLLSSYLNKIVTQKLLNKKSRKKAISLLFLNTLLFVIVYFSFFKLNKSDQHLKDQITRDEAVIPVNTNIKPESIKEKDTITVLKTPVEVQLEDNEMNKKSPKNKIKVANNIKPKGYYVMVGSFREYSNATKNKR